MSGLAFQVESWKADALRRCVPAAGRLCSGKPRPSHSTRAVRPSRPAPPTRRCVSSATARTSTASARSRRRGISTPAPRRAFSIQLPLEPVDRFAPRQRSRPRGPRPARCRPRHRRTSTSGATPRLRPVTRCRRSPRVPGSSAVAVPERRTAIRRRHSRRRTAAARGMATIRGVAVNLGPSGIRFAGT